MKLDLGAGAVSPAGFTPLGNINGTSIFPLPYGDGTVDECRASHVLEHFPHGQSAEVLAEWVRVLKPGGTISIAVPNFRLIAERYLAGEPQNTLGYVMGGQIDAADYHKAQFDEENLKRLLAGAGLMLIREWRSEIPDCAALPISLNLAATKPYMAEIGVSAVMSVPRLGFLDNMFCSFEALPPLRIKLRRYTGAYWSQCIERVIEEALADDAPDAVLTLDYDSIFSRRDVAMLMQLMCCHPEADAVAAVQSGRGKDLPLFTMQADDGTNMPGTPATTFAPDLSKVSTAHFGLTLIRADKIRALSKPWFRDEPDANGGWGEGRVDADINFWRKWEAAGNSLYLANRVPIGHLELQVLWPGADLRAVVQPVSEWRANGKPQGIWQ